MRIYILTLLITITVSVSEAAENPYLPFTFKSGDEVIFSLNKQGTETKSNIKNFCKAFKNNQPEILQAYNERFEKNKIKKLQYACITAANMVINNLKTIGYTRCLENPFNKSSIDELCRDSKKRINVYKPQLNFFSENYIQIKLKEKREEVDSINQSNNALLASIEKQRNEKLAFCESKYENVKKNDLKGIVVTKSIIESGADIDQLNQISSYKYLSPSMNKVCLQQERYKSIVKQVNDSKKSLREEINRLKKEQTKVVVVEHKESLRKPEIKTYTYSPKLLEPNARIPSGVKNTPQALEQIVRLIKLGGYKCDSVSGIVEMAFSRGFSVWCNNHIYEYEIEDKGGNWIVTVQ